MIACKDGANWLLLDGIKRGETFGCKEKIKALGGRWDKSRKVWVVPELAVEELGAERSGDPFYPNLMRLHRIIGSLGMHDGLALRVTHDVKFEYQCYESWGVRVKLELLPFTPLTKVAENFQNIVQSFGVKDSPEQWSRDSSLPAFTCEGPMSDFDKLCEKAVDFVISWRENGEQK